MTTGNKEHGWCETIRNAACCHQTSFNISLIVEKLLNNNVELTEKVNMMMTEQNKQRNTSENNKDNQMARAEEKDFSPNRVADGKEHDERTLIDDENDVDDKGDEDVVEKKQDVWIVPKNTCQ